MNIAIIFGGGVGSRFSKNGTPKQFVELYGKPIIAYTLEQFSNNPLIDEIVIPCVSGWADYLKRILIQFNITKPCHIIAGGATSHESRLHALHYINDSFPDTKIVVLHDAVRPLVTQANISTVVESAIEHGAAASYVLTTETPAHSSDFRQLSAVYNRSSHIIIKAPQAFSFPDTYQAHIDGVELSEDIQIDCCSLMSHYGKSIHLVESTYENIKITTAKDYFIFKALIDAKHYEAIFGI